MTATRRAPSPTRPGLAGRLMLLIRDTPYSVRRIACDPVVADLAFRLLKPDGTIYDVIQTQYGPECDCPDFIFRRDGLDPVGCKHVRALVETGLIVGNAV